ncbi:MAG: hypothetical protein UIL37_05705 [Clostridia bacterium]|nr:hypothetical protein [Clostridia bacterium]
MNWSKLKSIMIFMLFGINIFLLIFMGITTFNENRISDKVITATVNTLKAQGFECDEAIIPRRDYSLPVLTIKFYSAVELSDMFFGKQMPFRTENDSLIAENGNKVLTVKSNYFSFSSGKTPVKSDYKTLCKALKKAGIDISESVYDSENNYFYGMYKNANLFNMYIRAETDKNGELCVVEAQWPSLIRLGSQQNLSFFSRIMKIKEGFPNGGKIENIELGYELKPPHGDNYEMVPSWRITVGGNPKLF